MNSISSADSIGFPISLDAAAPGCARPRIEPEDASDPKCDGSPESKRVPRHLAITGDALSCDLIMKQCGDGRGHLRGWPGRSHYIRGTRARLVRGCDMHGF